MSVGRKELFKHGQSEVSSTYVNYFMIKKHYWYYKCKTYTCVKTQKSK